MPSALFLKQLTCVTEMALEAVESTLSSTAQHASRAISFPCTTDWALLLTTLQMAATRLWAQWTQTSPRVLCHQLVVTKIIHCNSSHIVWSPQSFTSRVYWHHCPQWIIQSTLDEGIEG